MNKLNIAGNRYGRLLVLNEYPLRKFGKVRWECLCECGVVTIAYGTQLINGHTSSCGCLNREITRTRNHRHGKSKTKVYQTWLGIRKRCTNPKRKDWMLYGGRGIKVSDEWYNSFDSFLRDVGEPPFQSAQIDRIDNNGNYEPGNVRWISNQQNSHNRRNNRLVAYMGNTITLAELSASTGICYGTLLQRHTKGWPLCDGAVAVSSGE